MGAGNLKAVLVPLLVVFVVTPLIVVVSLLLVALMMTPSLVTLVERNRFAGLQVKNGGGLAASLWWSLYSTVLAALAMLVSVPLWLVPPLVLMLPPLIWGWLTYRVMAFDALSKHASREERQILFKRHGSWLLLMGVICGYLGASPSVVCVTTATAACAGSTSASAACTLSTTRTFSGASPATPTTSSCRRWPMHTTAAPCAAKRRTSA